MTRPLPDAPSSPAATALRRRPAILFLALLVALGDFLFWRYEAGLSLALFAAALFLLSASGPPRPLALAALILTVLPVIEFVQPLSVAILALGLLAALCLQRGARPSALLPSVAALARALPGRGVQDLARAGQGLVGQDISRAGQAFARAWALPLGGVLVLTSLLIAANPVLDQWLERLSTLPFDPATLIFRLLFWGGLALLTWPLLVARPDPLRLPTRPGPDPRALGLNAASVGNGLVLFNAALALQSLLDARYLWAGTTPPGMTLAAYAHRGAYPLLATAFLAGAFALAARPFVSERPGLRALLYLWLGQNILLTLSALYRLDLYVQSFGLTYLRVHAAIWMALVALGLCLTLWQAARGHGAAWLLWRSAALGAATLYACAFVNFADFVARTNVAMSRIDPSYLCQLGPTAAAALPRTLWQVSSDEYDLSSRTCTLAPPAITGWRDWGFRNWRVLHNLAAQQEAAP